MKANKQFKANLRALLKGDVNISRPKYTDGTQSSTLSIKQVFESYTSDESVLHNYRNTATKLAIQEIFWIYQDQTNCLDKARERGINWWDEFNVGDNTIGKAYGQTIKEYDLLDTVLDDMVKNPFSRRHIIDMWQIEHIRHQYKVGGLVPCAYSTIWNINSDYSVDFTLIQRSGDYITANSAINKIQYKALALMVCGHLTNETNMAHPLRNMCHYTHDRHIYDRHLNACNELISKDVDNQFKQDIVLKSVKNFYDYTIDDFDIIKLKVDKLSSDIELAI